mmetsp:Transcript_79684/g.213070  ORF Transcript_79684/g.213070 Transcript_79684/m.213070 type:complete len:109 (+) Transcript_79684:14-340(+)
MLFCPNCGNILALEQVMGRSRFGCSTCAYVFNVREKYSVKTYLPFKPKDDVVDPEEAKKKLDMTDATCPACSNSRAYFEQHQIRSADEPSTKFYQCTDPKCAATWRED